MIRVDVSQERGEVEVPLFLAVAGGNQASGRTAGEALDALAAQLPKEDTGTLVIVRNLEPDRFFSAESRRRLEALMALRREAQARNDRLAPEAHEELERLVDEETRAATERARSLARDLGV